MFRASFLIFFIFNNNIIYSLTGQGVDTNGAAIAADATQGSRNTQRPYDTLPGDVEPDARWSGDLDPRIRRIQGTITLQPPVKLVSGGAYFDGWKLLNDETSTGNNCNFSDGPDTNQAGSLIITSNQLKDTGLNDNSSKCTINANLQDSDKCGPNTCPNDNPYSPKCGTDNADMSTKCSTAIAILPGESGEFYVSSVQNQDCDVVDNEYHSADSTGATAGSEKRTCQGDTDQDRKRTSKSSSGAGIVITFPQAGWVTALRLDGAALALSGPSGDLNTPGGYTNVAAAETLTTAAGDGAGWTIMYQPDYPEVYLPYGYKLAEGTSGFHISSKYGGNADTSDNTRFLAVDDWTVPNVTCTPTAMHCPIPDIWGHIDYKTPSQYPEPAEGQCAQYKFGTNSFDTNTAWTCSDKTDSNAREHHHADGNSDITNPRPDATDGVYQTQLEPNANSELAADGQTEDNGQTVSRDRVGNKNANWAANCNDNTSYFFFEKISCGSIRKFHTDRSLIEDTVTLSPTEDMLNYILNTYYTTKAPLGVRSGGVGDTPGITFINKDYHIPPVLPPEIECTCLAAMDAYASLLSVESKTPTPGAPVTLDPEVLNTGTAKIAATLRVFQDPTYSIPVVIVEAGDYAQVGKRGASAARYLPVVVSRFYLEVSTKFTRNKITISDCQAAHTGANLNSTNGGALHPRTSYCDNSTFDTRTEGVPAGVTHMDRISMKKFKFQDQTTVHLQCKIRACDAQPCGKCTRRNLGAVDMAPVEGEIYAPPTTINISKFDRNALTFSMPTPTTTNVMSQQSAPISVPSTPQQISTMKPIEVQSAITLPVAPVWAINNKQEVAETLRKALQLTPSEVLIITSIALGRRLLQSAIRSLQSASVKIDFTIGVMNANRAQVTGSKLNALASGSTVQEFTQILDATLATVGKPQLQLNPSSVVFSQPKQNVNNNAAQQTRNPIQTHQAAGMSMHSMREQLPNTSVTVPDDNSKGEQSGSENATIFVIFAILLGGVLLYVVSNRKKQTNTSQSANLSYARKVQYTEDDLATMTN